MLQFFKNRKSQQTEIIQNSKFIIHNSKFIIQHFAQKFPTPPPNSQFLII